MRDWGRTWREAADKEEVEEVEEKRERAFSEREARAETCWVGGRERKEVSVEV